MVASPKSVLAKRGGYLRGGSRHSDPGDNIAFQGLQFTIDGYTIAGSGSLALTRLVSATIATDPEIRAIDLRPNWLAPGGINKAGWALLTLSGENSYAGGTTVSGGILSVGSDTNLGAAGVGLVLNGGELERARILLSDRTIALVPSVNWAKCAGCSGRYDSNL